MNPTTHRTGRRTIGLILLTLVTLALLMRPMPAHAGTASITELAVYRDPAATDADQIIYLEAGPASWKIKKVAREVDAQVDGLTIVTGVPGTCYRRPTALCVTVTVGSWNVEQQRDIAGYDQTWRGLMTYDSAQHRTVYLNAYSTRVRSRKFIATHELGHALGLDHDDWGAMSTPSGNITPTFTDSEINMLRAWYSVPRYAPAGA